MADEPYVPEVRRLYWLSSVLLDAFDPEPERPAMVLVISQTPGGEIFVGLRSSSERNGTSQAPCGRPDGLIAMTAITAAAMLRPVDQAHLDEHFIWDAVVEAGMVCVTVMEYPLPAALKPADNELLVRLPAGFPDAGPDMFWFAQPVTRTDGAEIPAVQVNEIHLGRSWQRWSRHIGCGWRPGADDLRSYMAYISKCINRAAQ